MKRAAEVGLQAGAAVLFLSSCHDHQASEELQAILGEYSYTLTSVVSDTIPIRRAFGAPLRPLPSLPSSPFGLRGRRGKGAVGVGSRSGTVGGVLRTELSSPSRCPALQR